MKKAFFISFLAVLGLIATIGHSEAGEGESGLRQLADSLGFELGVAFEGGQVYGSTWKEVVAKEFNQATIHWGVYWPHIQPKYGQYDFKIADLQVSYSQETDMKIRGHTLFFAGYSPEWLDNSDFSKEQLLDILRDHITKVMTRYKGQIHQWVVVNEPYIFPYRQNDVFYEYFGYDYIDYAYKAARDADSSAILIYNDANNHSANGLATALTQRIIKRLKAKGLVDAVGLQMHLNWNNRPSKKDVMSTMRSYGIDVYVTEFDVDLRDFPGSQWEKFSAQAEIYKDMLEACLESGVCKGFTMWGIGDKYSWLESSYDKNIISPDADPTVFDDNFRPKPAYFNLLYVLSQHVSGATKFAKP